MLLFDIYLLGAVIDWFVCTPLGFSYAFAIIIERDDPVTALPTLRTGTGQAWCAHGHGKGVYPSQDEALVSPGISRRPSRDVLLRAILPVVEISRPMPRSYENIKKSHQHIIYIY